MIGQTVAERYLIEAVVGRGGGMGTVYRATDLVESRPVALKALRVAFDDAGTALTRFHREFRVLARLDHPRIVRAFDYGTHQNVPYLTFEFLTGQTP